MAQAVLPEHRLTSVKADRRNSDRSANKVFLLLAEHLDLMITRFIDKIENMRHNLHTLNLQSNTLAGRTLVSRMIIRTPISIVIRRL